MQRFAFEAEIHKDAFVSADVDARETGSRGD
jgi:hypothetical protein